MKLWKALGVAGIAGVAATGAIIARNHRARAQLTPEQVRARLHQRVDELERAAEEAAEVEQAELEVRPGQEEGRGSAPAASSGSTDSSARA